MTALIFIVAPTLQTRVLPRVGVRPIIMTGMALGAVAMLGFFAQLTPSSTYAADVLPGLLIIGIGMPCIFAPSFATATLGVDRYEAGVASAMVNTSPAGRRRGRHRGPLDDLRQRGRQLRLEPCARPGAGGRRRDPRLHDRVLRRGGHVRGRSARRRARAAGAHPPPAAARPPSPRPTWPSSGARHGSKSWPTSPRRAGRSWQTTSASTGPTPPGSGPRPRRRRARARAAARRSARCSARRP